MRTKTPKVTISIEDISKIFNGLLDRKIDALRAEASRAVSFKRKQAFIQVGEHLINPEDVAGIKHAKRDLYILMLRSQPNPEFPIWIKEKDMELICKYFNIVCVDRDED